MEPVVRVDVWVLGARNHPLGYAKLPAMLVADFADLVDGAKRLNPATTPEAVRGQPHPSSATRARS